MDRTDLQNLLTTAFPGAAIEVRSEDGVHFAARIVDPSFEGKSRVARHQAVYAALGGRVGGEIHALSLQTLTPGEAGVGA